MEKDAGGADGKIATVSSAASSGGAIGSTSWVVSPTVSEKSAPRSSAGGASGSSE